MNVDGKEKDSTYSTKSESQKRFYIQPSAKKKTFLFLNLSRNLILKSLVRASDV